MVKTMCLHIGVRKGTCTGVKKDYTLSRFRREWCILTFDCDSGLHKEVLVIHIVIVQLYDQKYFCAPLDFHLNVLC